MVDGKSLGRNAKGVDVQSLGRVRACIFSIPGDAVVGHATGARHCGYCRLGGGPPRSVMPMSMICGATCSPCPLPPLPSDHTSLLFRTVYVRCCAPGDSCISKPNPMNPMSQRIRCGTGAPIWSRLSAIAGSAIRRADFSARSIGVWRCQVTRQARKTRQCRT